MGLIITLGFAVSIWLMGSSFFKFVGMCFNIFNIEEMLAGWTWVLIIYLVVSFLV